MPSISTVTIVTTVKQQVENVNGDIRELGTRYSSRAQD